MGRAKAKGTAGTSSVSSRGGPHSAGPSNAKAGGGRVPRRRAAIVQTPSQLEAVEAEKRRLEQQVADLKQQVAASQVAEAGQSGI